MGKKFKFGLLVSLLTALILVGIGCNGSDDSKVTSSKSEVKKVSLTLASCCVTEDVTVREIIPAFEAYWKNKTGQEVEIVPSFAGSGSLTNKVIGGDATQLAILSSETYPMKLQKEGFLTTDWKTLPNKGTVAKSVMVILTREGNPLGIKDFEDLAKPGVKVIHASPDTSGGAQWAIYSIYGSILKETETSKGKADEAKAYEILEKIEKNVISMPESSKQAAAQFESGQGDVLITYENEALLEIEKGKKFSIVVPSSTIDTDWTVVKIDKNIKPEDEEVVSGFIDFLFTDEAQTAYAKYGFRSINEEITAQYDKYAKVEIPFNIEYLGGTEKARATIIDDLWKKAVK